MFFFSSSGRSCSCSCLFIVRRARRGRCGSREIGLLPIFLFSDVLPSGGGTALLRGSHKKVASIIWEHAGTTGMTGMAVFGLLIVLFPSVLADGGGSIAVELARVYLQ